MGVGPTELIVLLVIILLLFGAKRIPELAKGLGSGMREFKKGSSGDYDEVEAENKDEKKDEEVLDRENEKAETRSENGSEESSEAKQEQRG